ncbi:MAG: tetratricopeptide repeat protein [Elusimicrobia bacterium]|nr:tetratricopeptide repeat protein [Elusimicrobiota bacterium]
MLPRLLSVGYWEGSLGSGAMDELYRPIPMLLFFLLRRVSGLAVWPFHALSVAVHAANSVLLWRLLARRYSGSVALSAAVLFAVLPVHSEAVAFASQLPEILMATWVLLAWLELEAPAPASIAGVGFFCLALLTKEQAILFPAVLALHDWAFHGERFWSTRRRGVYAALGACIAAYLVLRFAVLGLPVRVGSHYFAGIPLLRKLLTLARFAAANLAWPTATGLRLRVDFSRPLIPDSGTTDLVAWACLLGWALLAAEAVRRLAARGDGARAAFWALSAMVLFLPASNLLVSLNVIGAQRHLYLASAAFCVGAAQALEGLAPYRVWAVAGLSFWYVAHAWRANKTFFHEQAFYETAIRGNPRSAAAWAGLGAYLAGAGKTTEAAQALEESIRRDGRDPGPYYNLGKLKWDAGARQEAEALFRKALERNPSDGDTWVFLATVEEGKGDTAAAARALARALEVRPWDAAAHFNLARLLMAAGRNAEAARHFTEYLSLAPDSPDAAQTRALVERLSRP